MPIKPTPLTIIGRALLLYNALMLVLWIISFMLNGFYVPLSDSLHLLGSVINSYLFLLYLLWYANAFSKRSLIAFLPFLISLLLLVNLLYEFWTGKTAEMAFGWRSVVIRLWQWRCIETLVVFFICLRVYAKYFRSPSAAAA